MLSKLLNFLTPRVSPEQFTQQTADYIRAAQPNMRVEIVQPVAPKSHQASGCGWLSLFQRRLVASFGAEMLAGSSSTWASQKAMFARRECHWPERSGGWKHDHLLRATSGAESVPVKCPKRNGGSGGARTSSAGLPQVAKLLVLK